MTDVKKVKTEEIMNPLNHHESNGTSGLTKEKHKVALIGSGNWGSAISRILGLNAQKKTQDHWNFELDEEVRMWVFEEEFEGRKLTEIINTEHENKKYLPGYQLPKNVVAVPDLVESVKGATLLVFVVPHQFLERTCKTIKPHIHPKAKAISLIKGMVVGPEGPILLSETITKELGIECSVLMGANIADDVAKESFAEATVGFHHDQMIDGKTWRDLFNTHYFRVSAIDDIPAVELCGALKNIVALGAGFADGLKYSSNTKAAVVRLGLMEIQQFIFHFFPKTKNRTFFESCGIADLMVTCHHGRNRRVAEQFVVTGKDFETLEKELLNGQKLQGTLTCEEVYPILKSKGLLSEFPLFHTIHLILTKELPPSELISHMTAHSKSHWYCTPFFDTH